MQKTQEYVDPLDVGPDVPIVQDAKTGKFMRAAARPEDASASRRGRLLVGGGGDPYPKNRGVVALDEFSYSSK